MYTIIGIHTVKITAGKDKGREGKIEKTNIVFEDDEHITKIIDKIVSPLGRRVDESNPLVDARLPDVLRFRVIIPPR